MKGLQIFELFLVLPLLSAVDIPTKFIKWLSC